MKQLATEYAEKMQRTIAPKCCRMSENDVTEIIVGCAVKVHKVLGPGLSKSAYEECMGYALSKTGLEIERRKPFAVLHGEDESECNCLMDFLANKKVVLEIYSADGPNDTHLSKIQTCMHLFGCRTGLLINFNVENLASGIKRVVSNHYRCRSLRINRAS
jgi:GxxExxY protein